MPPAFECVAHGFKTKKFAANDLLGQAVAVVEITAHTFQTGEEMGLKIASDITAAFQKEKIRKIDEPVLPCAVTLNPEP